MIDRAELIRMLARSDDARQTAALAVRSVVESRNEGPVGRLASLAIELAADVRRLALEARAELSYKCPRCGITSYNQGDIEHRYCSKCHRYNGTDEV